MNKKVIIIVIILIVGVAAYFMFFKKKPKVPHTKGALILPGSEAPETYDSYEQAQDVVHGSEYLPHQ
jgi:flagellar basal body-associated protein FliL